MHQRCLQPTTTGCVELDKKFWHNFQQIYSGLYILMILWNNEIKMGFKTFHLKFFDTRDQCTNYSSPIFYVIIVYLYSKLLFRIIYYEFVYVIIMSLRSNHGLPFTLKIYRSFMFNRTSIELDLITIFSYIKVKQFECMSRTIWYIVGKNKERTLHFYRVNRIPCVYYPLRNAFPAAV
ncbi:hypothetical protein AGLY_013573 [Aphis glycines]|uniref:Uncharacterized protein n=1 Tax=Aphis glycines TaxID=307491 RepID=A0A6G0T8U7_APHGL|nr:hypothetical protein AGLY_013573 [Aphis glycines]